VQTSFHYDLVVCHAIVDDVVKRMQPSPSNRAEHHRIHEWHFRESGFEKIEAFDKTSDRFRILS
jgi:hypothetical protein